MKSVIFTFTLLFFLASHTTSRKIVANSGRTLSRKEKCSISRETCFSDKFISRGSAVLLAKDSPSVNPVVNRQTHSSSSFSETFLSIFLPFLYFFCTSMNIPTLPKYVNWVINNGNSDVSAHSAEVYGNISGLDAFFTFLSVNFVGVLSDRYGRKPFMILSAFGLGVAYLIASFAKTPKQFYIAACIDGLTSCMLSQSQAFIADRTDDSSDISVALSRFQGLAIGFAFMFGVPLGGYLGSKYSYRTPVRLAVGICFVNCILISLFLPKSSHHKQNPPLETSNFNELGEIRKEENPSSFEWNHANPFNAIALLFKNRSLFFASLAYLAIQCAQAGLQVNWINFLQYKFGWSAVFSGSTLMMIGIVLAVIPPIIIPILGVKTAILSALIVHFISMIYLASTNRAVGIFAGMPFLSAGASAMPMILGFLTDQVKKSEVGALQGAADALRTLSSMIGSPLFAKAFGYFISNNRNFPGGALYLSSIFSLVAFGFFFLSIRS